MPIIAPPIAPVTEDPAADERSGSPFALIPNLLSDIKDLGLGVATFGGAMLHDLVYNPVHRLFSDGTDLHSEVKDIVWAAPGAIAKDYSERYGVSHGLLGGHFSQLFKSPLSFITDAFVVGDAAVKAADVAAKSAQVGAEAAAAGATTVGEEAAMAAPRLVGEAGTREATLLPAELTQDQLSSAAKFVARVRGTAKYFTTSDGRIVEYAAADNPVKRILLQKPYLKFATESGSVEKAVQTALGSGEDGLRFAHAAHEFHSIMQEADLADSLSTAAAAGDEAIRAAGAAEEAGAAAKEALPKLRSWADTKFLNKFVDRAVGTAHASRRLRTAAFDADAREVQRLAKNVDPGILDDNARGLDRTLSEDEYVVPEGQGTRDSQVLGSEEKDVVELPESWHPAEGSEPSGVAGAWDGATTGAAKAGATPEEVLQRFIDEHGVDPANVHGTPNAKPGVGAEAAANGAAASLRTGDAAAAMRHLDAFENVTNKTLGGTRWADELAASAGEAAPAADAATTAQAVAKADRAAFVPRLRKLFGAGVVVDPGAKSLDAIAAHLKMYGYLPDDVSRLRIILSDADIVDPAKVQEAIDKVAEGTGGKLRYRRGSVLNPAGDGSRKIRTVFEVGEDSHPLEVQFATLHSAEMEDATSVLRADNMKSALAAKDSPALLPSMTLRIKTNNAWMQSLNAGLSNDIRKALGGYADDSSRVALQRLHEITFKHITGPAISEMGLDAQAAFANRFAARRLLNGAEVSKGAEVNGLIGGESPLFHADEMAKAGTVGPTYVPVMPTGAIPKLTSVEVMSKGTKVEEDLVKAAVDPYARATEHVIMQRGDYIKDPLTTLRKRAETLARAQEGYTILRNVINEVGRPLNSLEEFNPAREVLIEASQLEGLHQGSTSLIDAVLASPEGGEVGAVQKTLEDLYQKGKNAVADGVANPRYIAIPKVATKRLEQFAKYSMPESVRLFAGTPTKLFKQVSLMSPGFLLRHTFRLAAYDWMNGGSLIRSVRLMNGKYFSKVLEALPEEMRAEVAGTLGSASDVSKSVWSDTTTSGRIANAVQGNEAAQKAASIARKPQTLLRSIQGRVEEAFRADAALTALEKTGRLKTLSTWGQHFLGTEKMLDSVYTAGLDEATARAGMTQMKKMLISYDDLGPLERNIVAPYLVPFYPAYKFAAKMALNFPLEAPLKATAARIIKEAGEYGQPLPGWAEGGLPLGEPTDAGDLRFLSASGLNPFHVVSEEPANLANPMLKMLFEQATGVDTYTGKEFTAENVVDVGGRKYQINPDGTVKEVDKVTPSLIQAALSQVPQYDTVKDLLAAGSTYDTASISDILQGRGVEIDPVTGEPKFPDETMDTLAKFFGYSTYDYNVTKYQADRVENMNSALKEYLARQGG